MPVLHLLRLLCVCMALAMSSLAADEDATFFEERIRPVLVEHCYECHSAKGKQKGGLLLDTAEGLLRGGDSGAAIVSGKPDESLLLKAIRYEDEDLQMPPKKGHLPDSVIADIERWIRAGAAYPKTSASTLSPIEEARQRWPYAPRVRTEVPRVANRSWPQSDIDRFILARLEAEKLWPSPTADRRTLIRRATFDLIGLPPTAEEVEEFVNDQSPKAFERVVERLLASPLYGERWARHWLDVVRYTDSFDSRGLGGEADVPFAYRYRDWVVKTFNDDLSYDQFIINQIAGDIVAERSPGGFDTNALIATGMYVFGEWGLGDADKEKMLTDIVDDQIDVTGRAFLGLTLACARCHDHKFDPISAKDYYAMAGIFFSSHILPNPGVKTGGSPTKRVPLASAAQIKERDESIQKIAAMEKERDGLLDETISKLATNQIHKFAALMSDNRDAAASAVDQLFKQALHERLGLRGGTLLARKIDDVAGNREVYAWKLGDGADTPSLTVNGSSDPVTIGTLTLPPRSVAAHPSPKTGVSIVWNAAEAGDFKLTASIADADDKCGDGVTWALRKVSAGASFILHTNSIINGGKDATSEISSPLAAGDSVELTIYPKGAYECDTTTVSFKIKNGASGAQHDLTSDLLSSPAANPVTNKEGSWAFREASPQSEVATGSILAEFALSGASPEKRKSLAETLQAHLLEFHNSGETNDSPEYRLYADIKNPRSRLWAGFRSPSPAWETPGFQTVSRLERERKELRDRLPPAFPVTHALQEGGTPQSPHAGFNDARVHIRGKYDRLGDKAPRAFPSVVCEEQPTIKSGSGRLELAQWIASPANPLTARVMVNRIWQHHFGEGIVRTANNFGKLGTPPTHPELLDFLADEFVKSGWSMKAMHRKIMLSATYQQSSVPHSEALKHDRENLLFSRANRRRLEAESIRDSLLFVANRLSPRSGGPAFRDLNSAGRTLYLMTIRSDRATYQTLFDAADASAIVEKRTESTVAPQALFLLNHPFAIQRAKELAALARDRSTDLNARVNWLYQRLYARKASGDELSLAASILQEDSNEAWNDYCHALLCANEFVYID